MSYHLTVFEPINQLLFINFPSLEHKIFLKDLKSTLPASVALRFRNLGNIKTWCVCLPITSQSWIDSYFEILARISYFVYLLDPDSTDMELTAASC